MMEKLKITVEQETALQGYKHISKIQNYFRLRFFIENKDKLAIQFRPLEKFSPEEFSLLLHGWYEVEKPKFEVGDWVRCKERNRYFKVVERSYRFTELSLGFVEDFPCDYEKVTEQWKIVLLEAGREKPELKSGDVYVYESGVSVHVIVESNHNLANSKSKIKYFYPVESRIEL